jgi:hypothetical protein
VSVPPRQAGRRPHSHSPGHVLQGDEGLMAHHCGRLARPLHRHPPPGEGSRLSRVYPLPQSQTRHPSRACGTRVGSGRNKGERVGCALLFATRKKGTGGAPAPGTTHPHTDKHHLPVPRIRNQHNVMCAYGNSGGQVRGWEDVGVTSSVVGSSNQWLPAKFQVGAAQAAVLHNRGPPAIRHSADALVITCT